MGDEQDTAPARPGLVRRARARAGRIKRSLFGADTPRPAGRPGHAPEVTPAPTHLGPVFDQRVARAHGQVRLGVDPDYDLVYDNFDVAHYLLQAPHAAERPGLDPVDHFLKVAPELRRSPHPDFSPEVYLARHPEHQETPERSPYLEWLKRGRDAGEIADPAVGVVELAPALGMTPGEVVDLVRERRTDLTERLRHGTLGEMFAKAAAIEPLIGEGWLELSRPRMIPFTLPGPTAQIAALHAAQEAAGFRRARVVFVVNRPRWGGGRRLEGHVAHGLADGVPPEDILVIYTDEGGATPEDRFPRGVREVDLASLVADLEPDDAQFVLVALLRSFGADAIVNVNSRLLYHALRVYGRALAASERLFLVFFCNEQTALGVWYGWSQRYFYRTFDYVAGVITDSQALADDLRHTYRLTDAAMERVHVFSAPVDTRLPLTEPPVRDSSARPQIFWAGRWDRQKRIDLLFRVAEALPEVDIRMWGETVLKGGRQRVPANVHPQGAYGHFTELPLHEADLWLYTSGWDGVPSLLLEVAMTGIPIVGTRVGGTGEVLDDDLAWPVDADADADAYVHAVREVLADPATARARATRLRQRLDQERSAAAFADQVGRVLLRPADETGGEPR
ncbi:MAG: glycosyltransferase family 4 protein [Nocardioidaceae bacterium]